MADKTIFKRIIDREIRADIVYEDDFCLAFRDLSPQAPTHVLVIPKQEIATVDAIADDDVEVMGRLWLGIRNTAKKLGLDHGYRVVVNSGRDAGQEVQHLHAHLLGGRRFGWPPG
ncbi:MAG: histidine triad nucleotide-binding protein [Pirellulales bacterium]